MITNRSVQLSEALAEQKGVVDLSKWISFFACVHSFLPCFCRVYDLFVPDTTLCMIWRQCFSPMDLKSIEHIEHRFGGGVEMIRDGDVDGLWHLMEAGHMSVFALLCSDGSSKHSDVGLGFS